MRCNAWINQNKFSIILYILALVDSPLCSVNMLEPMWRASLVAELLRGFMRLARMDEPAPSVLLPTKWWPLPIVPVALRSLTCWAPIMPESLWSLDSNTHTDADTIHSDTAVWSNLPAPYGILYHKRLHHKTLNDLRFSSNLYFFFFFFLQCILVRLFWH